MSTQVHFFHPLFFNYFQKCLKLCIIYQLYNSCMQMERQQNRRKPTFDFTQFRRGRVTNADLQTRPLRSNHRNTKPQRADFYSQLLSQTDRMNNATQYNLIPRGSYEVPLQCISAFTGTKSMSISITDQPIRKAQDWKIIACRC